MRYLAPTFFIKLSHPCDSRIEALFVIQEI